MTTITHVPEHINKAAYYSSGAEPLSVKEAFEVAYTMLKEIQRGNSYDMLAWHERLFAMERTAKAYLAPSFAPVEQDTLDAATTR